jgi:hypothetical protein
MSVSASPSLLDAVMQFFKRMWDSLPSADVLMFYAAVGACLLFAVFLVFNAFFRRKPLNIDTIIKENKYIAVTKQTLFAFCFSAVATALFLAFNSRLNTASGASIGWKDLSPEERAFKLALVGMFGCAIYVLYQCYQLLNWSVTNTPRELTELSAELKSELDYMRG